MRSTLGHPGAAAPERRVDSHPQVLLGSGRARPRRPPAARAAPARERPRATSRKTSSRVLLRHAEAIADELEAAAQDVAAPARAADRTGPRRGLPSAAAVLLPPVLARLLQQALGLDLRLVELEPPEAEAAVRDGSADLAVVFRHERDLAPPEGDLLREPLSRHAVLAVVPSSCAEPAVDLADLRGERWIAGCERCRASLLRCASAAGSTPDVRFATDDHVVVQRLVAAGLGVALLPAWAFDASTQPGVRAVAVRGVGDRVVEVLVRPDSRRVPAVVAVLAGLRS